MRKTLLATALLSVLGASSAAFAADAPAVVGNLSVVSDYRFRGISQTFVLPALQGGFDYAHSSGFYVGNWNSSLSGVQYPNGAGLEMDFYAGYKTEVAGVGIDLGTLYYYYPGAKYNTVPAEKFDNHEVYIGASFGPVTVKYSYAVTDYFGLNEVTGTNSTSEGTSYAEINFAKEVIPKLTLSAHVGATMYKNHKDLDYTDFKLAVGYDLNGFALGLAYVDNDVKTAGEGFYTATNGNGKLEQLFDAGAVLSVTKTF